MPSRSKLQGGQSSPQAQPDSEIGQQARIGREGSSPQVRDCRAAETEITWEANRNHQSMHSCATVEGECMCTRVYALQVNFLEVAAFKTAVPRWREQNIKGARDSCDGGRRSLRA